jgi:type IV secretion system protein VirB10
MKLRNIPIPAGLNKNKLRLVAGGLIGAFLIILFWVLYASPIGGNSKASPEKTNYAKNDNAGSDVDDILGKGKKHASAVTASSAPTATHLNKHNSSAPQAQDDTAKQQASQQAELQAAQEVKAAMKAPLSSNQISPQSNGGSSSATNGQSSAPVSQDSGLPKDDPSMTSEKRNFMKSQNDLSSNVLSTSLSNPVARLVLSMGTKIPAQLDQEINSDLPGQIYGHVSRDVFDSRTHDNLLIPAGSNLVGTYDSALAYGQERLLVAWKRVNLPNGQWIDIQGMGGADPVGAGFGDQVDNHYWRIFGATFLTSVLSAGAQLAQPQQSNALQAPGVGQTVGQSVGTQIATTGTMLLQKNINIQPTIHIRAGFEFTVEVNKDIAFPNAYTSNANKN